jgi:hypothetical protein
MESQDEKIERLTHALRSIVERLDYVPRHSDTLDALNMAKAALDGKRADWQLYKVY